MGTWDEYELLADDVVVFRLHTKNPLALVPPQKIPLNAFDWSTDDKEADPPHLSVYDQALTDVVTAHGRLNNTRQAADQYVFEASACDIRKCAPDEYPLCNPDVIRTPDSKPGGDGHCGLVKVPYTQEQIPEKMNEARELGAPDWPLRTIRKFQKAKLVLAFCYKTISKALI